MSGRERGEIRRNGFQMSKSGMENLVQIGDWERLLPRAAWALEVRSKREDHSQPRETEREDSIMDTYLR